MVVRPHVHLEPGNGDYGQAYRVIAAEVGDTWAGPIVAHNWTEALEIFEEPAMADAVEWLADWLQADGILSGEECRECLRRR